MRLHRFIGNFDLNSKELRINDSELRNQIIRVLRLGVGDEIELSDGNLNEARVKIVDTGLPAGKAGKDIQFNVLERWQNQKEPDRHVILYCAVLKKENFELVVQKATEIGIKEIVPLITARTVKLDIRKDRLEKIIKEAAEQSGRGVMPVLREPADFSKAVEGAKNNGINILFDQSGKSISQLSNVNSQMLSLWIGPEGGWTSEELALAGTLGFEMATLGKTTLRAETAAIVGSYIIINNK